MFHRGNMEEGTCVQWGKKQQKAIKCREGKVKTDGPDTRASLHPLPPHISPGLGVHTSAPGHLSIAMPLGGLHLDICTEGLRPLL